MIHCHVTCQKYWGVKPRFLSIGITLFDLIMDTSNLQMTNEEETLIAPAVSQTDLQTTNEEETLVAPAVSQTESAIETQVCINMLIYSSYCFTVISE